MSRELPAPDIELRVWRQFLALAETLHFGRAAQRLHMTQPPLTQAIQQLERRLGVPLFERTRRSVALTPAGAALVEPVRQVLRQAGALALRARDAAGGELGRIRLGFVSTVGFGPLPGWLRAFREAHPGITVELREATGDVQAEAFAQRELDAGFVLHAPGIAPPPPLQRLSLGVEPMLLALHDAAPRRLGAAQLLREPLVIFPRAIAPSLYDAVLAFYHRHGATPAIAQEAIQMQTIVNLVSAGLGVALVPRAMRQLQRPGIVYRALPAALADGAPRAETSLVWPSDASPAVRRFVAFVREQGPRER
ncbi:LysR family transcriptional regulator [Piscinibacter sp.]|uniref:LysR family transcriptional regulator n=1 Tax=Piscinibacter sp. TaxID=1903157 RepID=UPI0039E47541